MNHGSLFSGIGGFDLAASWMGWNNIFQVEIDPYCQKVLAKNFVDTKKYLNIFDFDGTQYRGNIDIISGGFPCQGFSMAGKRKGREDERYLWPQMLRIIREIKPRFVVAENVPGILSIERGLVVESLCVELEAEGYEVQPVIIPACGKGAPHKRDRVWFVAYAGCGNGERQFHTGENIRAIGAGDALEPEHPIEGDGIRVDPNANHKWELQPEGTIQNIREWSGDIPEYDVTNSEGAERKSTSHTRSRGNGSSNSDFPTTHTKRIRQSGSGGLGRRLRSEPGKERKTDRAFDEDQFKENWIEVATKFCRVDARIPNRVDRLRGLGNSVSPPVVLEIFKAIESCVENYS